MIDVHRQIPVFFFLSVGLLSWLMQSASTRRRTRRMNTLTRRNLRSYGNNLPEDFPLEAVTPTLPWYITGDKLHPNNAVSGPDGNDLLLAFDLRIGGGRYSQDATVVARRSTRTRPLPTGDPAYVLQEIRNWRIAIYSKGLLEPETIRLLWHALE